MALNVTLGLLTLNILISRHQLRLDIDYTSTGKTIHIHIHTDGLTQLNPSILDSV